MNKWKKKKVTSRKGTKSHGHLPQTGPAHRRKQAFFLFELHRTFPSSLAVGILKRNVFCEISFTPVMLRVYSNARDVWLQLVIVWLCWMSLLLIILSTLSMSASSGRHVPVGPHTKGQLFIWSSYYDVAALIDNGDRLITLRSTGSGDAAWPNDKE